MLKKTVFALALPLVSLFAIGVATPLWGVPAVPASKTAHTAVATAPAPSGTFQKMIVENGSVSMVLDLDALDPQTFPGSLTARPATLQFAVAADSFFPILAFNDLLRAAEPGSMTLIPQNSVAGGGDPGMTDSGDSLPEALGASLKQLVVEKLASGQAFDLAVRDGKTGFTFFNVEGADYRYDANAQSLTITNGRLLISKEFASALGRPSDAGAVVGKISVGAAMQPIEIAHLDANGDVKSASLPALYQPDVGTVPGPDVIVGNLLDLVQMDSGAVNGQVGVSLGTDACNKGTVDVDWIALPSNDHPFIPQNLYRMSGGAENAERFEQIGQSWG